MNGGIPPFPQYTSMAWCSVKAQGELYLFTCIQTSGHIARRGSGSGVALISNIGTTFNWGVASGFLQFMVAIRSFCIKEYDLGWSKDLDLVAKKKIPPYHESNPRTWSPDISNKYLKLSKIYIHVRIGAVGYSVIFTTQRKYRTFVVSNRSSRSQQHPQLIYRPTLFERRNALFKLNRVRFVVSVNWGASITSTNQN